MKKQGKNIAIIVFCVALVAVLVLYIGERTKPATAQSSSLPPALQTSLPQGSALQPESTPPPESIAELMPEYQDDNIPLEIERKFLIDLNALPEGVIKTAEKFVYVQTYISFEPEVRVRSIDGKYFRITVKLPKDEEGLARSEIDVLISEQEYNKLLEMKMGETIYKTRHRFYVGETKILVDVYTGWLDGLAVAEVEFDSVEAAAQFEPPKWFGKDITSDKRYKNASLAQFGIPDPA